MFFARCCSPWGDVWSFCLPWKWRTSFGVGFITVSCKERHRRPEHNDCPFLYRLVNAGGGVTLEVANSLGLRVEPRKKPRRNVTIWVVKTNNKKNRRVTSTLIPAVLTLVLRKCAHRKLKDFTDGTVGFASSLRTFSMILRCREQSMSPLQKKDGGHHQKKLSKHLNIRCSYFLKNSR